MALLGKINDTVIKVAANNCEYCWYCIEDVGLQEHNAWLLNDDFTGITVDGAVRQDQCNHNRGRYKYL